MGQDGKNGKNCGAVTSPSLQDDGVWGRSPPQRNPQGNQNQCAYGAQKVRLPETWLGRQVPGCRCREVEQFEPSGPHTSGVTWRACRNTDCCPAPGVSDAGLLLELTVLTSSQKLLKLLFLGPHFETHCSDLRRTFHW